MPLPALVSTPSRLDKAKSRAVSSRDDPSGGPDGALISLQLLQDSAYESVYVAPVQIGSSGSQYLLQVDIGSSDLWVASTSCSTSPCADVGSHKYDPSHSLPTGQSASVDYAQGEVDGPIVWDSVSFGGYSIDHQALIAATNVNQEPLSSNFDGVLGLSPPLNSVIAHVIPPTTSDSPDGAALSSNLFGITPLATAPGARFLSLALERPGSDKVPSLLAIGYHPPDLVSDPSKIQYAKVVPEAAGSLFWQADVRAITVYADGQPKPVSLPPSTTGTNGYPSAILDSGVPLILASPQIAYGIYGAMGYSPASDGNVYIPCSQPLNVSITLDDRSEVFLHPLDLTYYPPGEPSGETCIGAIQTPEHLGVPVTQADMVLGVPFLRNTYTVLAYDQPAANGSFPPNTGSDRIQPFLGLLQLTDPATAAAEFYQVRVLKQPLGTSAGAAQGLPHKGLSVGIEVLIGLLGFFGFCFALFGARLAYMKRKWLRARPAAVAADGVGGDSKEGSYVLNELGYHPSLRKSHSSEPSEDELRLKRFEEYKRRRELESQYTDDSAITRVADADVDKGVDEFGALKVPVEDGDHDPWRDTLLDSRSPPSPPLRAPSPSMHVDDLPLPPPTAQSARRASYASSPMVHQRTLSGGPSPATPLLGHVRSNSGPRDSEDIADNGMPSPAERERPLSMAGIGTSARSRRLGSAGSGSTLMVPPSPLLSPDHRRSFPPTPYSQSSGLVASPRALEPVLAASRNDSRVSDIGHEA